MFWGLIHVWGLYVAFGGLAPSSPCPCPCYGTACYTPTQSSRLLWCNCKC